LNAGLFYRQSPVNPFWEVKKDTNGVKKSREIAIIWGFPIHGINLNKPPNPPFFNRIFHENHPAIGDPQGLAMALPHGSWHRRCPLPVKRRSGAAPRHLRWQKWAEPLVKTIKKGS
jgi:hypothetical protein